MNPARAPKKPSKPARRTRKGEVLWVAAWIVGIAAISLYMRPHFGNPLAGANLRSLEHYMDGHSDPHNAAVFRHAAPWALWLVIEVRLTFIVADIAWKALRRAARRLRWPATTWTVHEHDLNLMSVAQQVCGDARWATLIASANEGRKMLDGERFDPVNLRPGWELRIPAGIPRNKRPATNVKLEAPPGLLAAEVWRWELLMGTARLPVPGRDTSRAVLRDLLRAMHQGLAEKHELAISGGQPPAWTRQDPAMPVWVDLAMRHAALQYSLLGRKPPRVRQVKADRWSVSIELEEGGDLLKGNWESFATQGAWWVLPRSAETAVTLASADLEDCPVPLLVPMSSSEIGTPHFVNLAVAGTLNLASGGADDLCNLLLANLAAMPWLDQTAVIGVGGGSDMLVDLVVSSPEHAEAAYKHLRSQWPAYRAALVITPAGMWNLEALHLPADIGVVAVNRLGVTVRQ